MSKKDLKEFAAGFSETLPKSQPKKTATKLSLPATSKLEITKEKPPQQRSRLKKIHESQISVSTVNEREQGLLSPEVCSDLIASIKEVGQQQPIQVIASSENDDDGQPVYDLISGSRRLFSIRHLAETSGHHGWVDCIILPGKVPDRNEDPENWLAYVTISNAENQYKKVSRYERALFIQKIWRSGIFAKQKDLADHFGFGEAWASKMLSFAKFPLDAAKALGEEIKNLTFEDATAWSKRYPDDNELVAKIQSIVTTYRESPEQNQPLISFISEEIKRSTSAKKRKGKTSTKTEDPENHGSPPDEDSGADDAPGSNEAKLEFDFGSGSLHRSTRGRKTEISFRFELKRNRDTLTDHEANDLAASLIEHFKSNASG